MLLPQRLALPALLLSLVVALVPAGESELERLKTLVAALPAPPAPVPQPGRAPSPALQLGTGVAVDPGAGLVVLSGTSLFDSGPIDGLEVLACLEGGKTHESLVRLLSGNADLVKSAFLLAMDLPDGLTADEGSAQPARGVPLRVRLWWQADPLIQPNAWLSVDASALVRDRLIDRAYPALAWPYTGSRIAVVEQALPDGRVLRNERFMLGNTRSVAVCYDEPDALIGSPFPLALVDHHFEANSALAPLPGSVVQLTLERATLPLTLTLDGSGLSVDGQVLDEAALLALLAQTFLVEPRPNLHSIGVRVHPGQPRSLDVAARERLLQAAAAAGVWAVPLFIPDASAPAP